MIRCSRRACDLPVEWITCVAGVTLFLCEHDHARLLSVRIDRADIQKLEEALERAQKERAS